MGVFKNKSTKPNMQEIVDGGGTVKWSENHALAV